VDALTAAGLRMEGPKRVQEPAGPLAGKTLVVTGTLAGFSRDEIAAHLAGLGAKVTNTVSSNTDYLLAGAGGGSKRAKAEQLGVPVLSEDDLARLVADPPAGG
jgi:DNA ligase (NAD+)